MENNLPWPFFFLQVLRITFTFFQLEPTNNCPHEFLQIHDGDSSAAHQLGRFCGSNPPHELLSSDNALYFHLYSEHLRSERGFTIRWETQLPGKYKHGEKESKLLRLHKLLISIRLLDTLAVLSSQFYNYFKIKKKPLKCSGLPFCVQK